MPVPLRSTAAPAAHRTAVTPRMSNHAAAAALERLLSLVHPVPAEWAEQARVEQAATREMQPIPCDSWATLREAWTRAIRWRDGLEDVLLVMLAVAMSTQQEGDQIYLQVVGPPGTAKCLGKGTPVLMLDGSTKLVEDVVTGDVLMGPDSLPRNVLSVARGREEMYRITPVKGDPYVVNESHILSLKKNPTSGNQVVRWAEGNVVHNMSVREYLRLPENKKVWYKGWRTGVDWPHDSPPIDPYFLGLWLGDGDSAGPTITTMDEEVVAYLKQYASTIGLTVNTVNQDEGRCPRYRMALRQGKSNPLLDLLRKAGVIGNKHIPLRYLANSREVRLGLLAGLLDSDGNRDGNCYAYTSVIRRLADDVAWLCRSLGLAAYVKPMRCVCTTTGVAGDYWRVGISGKKLKLIPVRIPRKKVLHDRGQVKDVLKTGITVDSIGEGDYFGFQIDGDGLFLLGDFTVTHNTTFCDAMLVSKTCKLLDSLTGFTSGYQGSEGEAADYSLISRINNKTLITPEGDVLMSNPRFKELMAQQRRMFDGTYSAIYKNRKDDQKWTGLRAPWIIAGTPAIMESDEASLGDRFLKVMVDDPGHDEEGHILDRVIEDALASVNRTSNCSPDTHMSPAKSRAYRMTGGFVDHLRANAGRLINALGDVEPRHRQLLKSCSGLTSYLRARPSNDPKKSDVEAFREMPARLAIQMSRLAKCVAAVLGEGAVTDRAMRVVRKVALDTARGKMLSLACLLREGGRDRGSFYQTLALRHGVSDERMGATLKFLLDIGAAECFRSGGDAWERWRLSERVERLWCDVHDF